MMCKINYVQRGDELMDSMLVDVCGLFGGLND